MNDNDIISLIVNKVNKKTLHKLLLVNKQFHHICLSSDIYLYSRNIYNTNLCILKNINDCNDLYIYLIKKFKLIFKLQNNLSRNRFDDNIAIFNYSEIIKNIRKHCSVFWFDNIYKIIEIIIINLDEEEDKMNIFVYSQIDYYLNKLLCKIIKKYKIK